MCRKEVTELDGGLPDAYVNGMPVTSYEAMRDLARQFVDGGMSIDVFIDGIERLAADATAMLTPH
mgnify:CR=1 FL=1